MLCEAKFLQVYHSSVYGVEGERWRVDDRVPAGAWQGGIELRETEFNLEI